jgi:hypothetical protein
MPATRLPFTYCIDYSPKNVTSAEFRQKLAAGPPTIVHVGHDLPFRAVAITNPGYEFISPAPASAAEVSAQIEQLKQYIRDLRAAGVSTVIPYITNCIMWGDHERRLGFWAAYDHWYDYAEFGIGERPPTDPIDWLQGEERKPATPHEGYWYSPCPNNDYWTDYLAFTAHWAANCGYDGIFMDVNTCWCFCSYCQRKFREYLTNRYTADELRRHFGITDIRAVALTEDASPALNAEIETFRAHSIAENVRRVRDSGAAVRKGFIQIPNIGPFAHLQGADHRRGTGKDIELWAPVSDYIMYEEMLFPGNLGGGAVVDDILQYKLSYAFGSPAVVLCYIGNDTRSTELALAEAAAFSGGGAFVQPGEGWPEMTNRYNRFVREHRDLYEGCEPAARVGLAFLYHQVHMSDPEHLRGIYRARDYLSEQQVLWDFVTDVSDPKRLTRFDAIVLTGGRFLSDAEIAALRQFVESGGTLFIIGEAGTHDPWGHRRSDAAFGDALNTATADEHRVRRASLGGGTILQATDPWAILPQRPYAIYDFTEDDLADINLVYKRLAESPEQRPGEAGVLLVDYLERAAGTRLRITASRAPYLRFDAYRRGGKDDGRIVLHAVNYNLPRTAPGESGQFVPSAPAEVTLHAPEGWNIVSAALYAPDSDPQPISFTQNGSAVTFTLPPVNVYSMVAFSTRSTTGTPD